MKTHIAVDSSKAIKIFGDYDTYCGLLGLTGNEVTRFNEYTTCGACLRLYEEAQSNK